MAAIESLVCIVYTSSIRCSSPAYPVGFVGKGINHATFIRRLFDLLKRESKALFVYLPPLQGGACAAGLRRRAAWFPLA